jgi:small-conductance mechanosensitive channel
MKIFFKLILLLMLLAPATLFAQIDSLKQKPGADTVDKTKAFPIAPFHSILFLIYNRQGSFTPAERAEAVSNRIIKLSDDISFSADSLVVSPSESSADILYKDNILISVSDKDALVQNTTRQKLADSLRSVIAVAITNYQHETSWQVLLKEGLTALLVIALLIIFIYVVNRLFKWIISGVNKLFNKGLKFNNYELLNAERQAFVINFILKAIKWFVILLLIYLALPILFGIFPFTQSISDTLLGYVISPLKKIGLAVWDYVPNLITILVLVVIFHYILRFIRYIRSEIAAGNLTIPGFYADWAQPTYQIIRVLILAFLLVLIFPYLPGSDSAIFKGVSVFVGVLFTFGSAGALGNIVSGLVMTYMRSFKLGDRVKIGEVTGDIIEKNLLVTRVRTIQNEIISIPNSTVLSSHTINYSSDALNKGLIMHTTVTIGYDAPWRQVHQLLIDAALDTPMIEHEPEPYVLQISLDDYYVSYRLNAFTKEPNKQAVIYSGLHANIQDQFNKAGVEIMSPHYKALRDGNATTIPADYLPKDYTPPPFNIHERKE